MTPIGFSRLMTIRKLKSILNIGLNARVYICSYAIVENLRYMLQNYSSASPLYFGCRFKPYVKQGYMSGGAGYVLSKEAVRRFVVQALPDAKLCRQDNAGAEDVEIGKCLANVKVSAADSRDAKKRGRFFPFTAEDHILPYALPKDLWFWKYMYYPVKSVSCNIYSLSTTKSTIVRHGHFSGS